MSHLLLVVFAAALCFSLSQSYNQVVISGTLEGWLVAIVLFLLILPSLLRSWSLAEVAVPSRGLGAMLGVLPPRVSLHLWELHWQSEDSLASKLQMMSVRFQCWGWLGHSPIPVLPGPSSPCCPASIVILLLISISR